MISEKLLAWNLQFRWLAARALAAHKMEPKIPSPALNYNQHPSRRLSKYLRTFKANACLKELPFLMGLGLRPDSVMFDYGCGLGRLAYAASKYLGTQGRYVGYEPNAQARAFLKEAYRDLRNFEFHGDEMQSAENYIAVKMGETKTSGRKSIDIRPQEFLARVVDIQYSSSVATHMWMDAISQLLENLNQVVKPDGLCVNTWLIIDDFAKYSLDCGLADRTLPFVLNGAYTYSQSNPLMCTAYTIDAVKQAYSKAGHEIVKILWGSWAGRENGVHYQDIVVSRPRQ